MTFYIQDLRKMIMYLLKVTYYISFCSKLAGENMRPGRLLRESRY